MGRINRTWWDEKVRTCFLINCGSNSRNLSFYEQSQSYADEEGGMVFKLYTRPPETPPHLLDIRSSFLLLIYPLLNYQCILFPLFFLEKLSERRFFTDVLTSPPPTLS